jgi:hypothetical protein
MIEAGRKGLKDLATDYMLSEDQGSEDNSGVAESK